MKIFKRKNRQETVEAETEIDLIAEIEIIQEIIIEIEAGIEEIIIEIGTGIEVEIEEIAEIIQEIETEVEVETGLIPEKEEETNQDQDQVKDILTEMIFATTVTEQVMLHIGASDLKII